MLSAGHQQHDIVRPLNSDIELQKANGRMSTTPDEKSSSRVKMVDVEGPGDAYLELFEAYGADYVFASPGSEMSHLWEFLVKFKANGRRLQYINCRHESLAVAMAYGYTHATNKAQVVLLHVDAGFLNGSTMIYGAYKENVQMVVVTGEVVTFEEENPAGSSFQYITLQDRRLGVSDLAAPITKWDYFVHTNLNVDKIIGRAFQLANANPKGPTVLTMSKETAAEKMTSVAIPKVIPEDVPSAPSKSILSKVSKLLVSAKLPVIIVGDPGRYASTVRGLVELTELIGAPVLQAYPNRTMSYPFRHPLHQGFTRSALLDEADLVLVVDSCMPWFPLSLKGPKDATVITIASDPLHSKLAYWTLPSDIMINADSRIAIPELVDAIKSNPMHQENLRVYQDRIQRFTQENERRFARNKEAAMNVRDDKPIDSKWLCHVLNNVIDQDSIIVSEMIIHSRDLYSQLERTKPGTFYSAILGGGLGAGLGMAMGLKLANKDKRVIALIGDGSFNYNPVPAAFGASQEYSLPFLTVIFNNQAYFSMRGDLLRRFKGGWSDRKQTYLGTTITPRPEYASLAKAWGGYGETVEDPEKIESALKAGLEAVSQGRFAIIDVVLKETISMTD